MPHWTLLLAMALSPLQPAMAQLTPETSAAQRLANQHGGAVDRTQLEKRLESVATLLERSSGAKQVEASAEPRARAKRSEAQSAYAQAQEAYRDGDYARSSRLLSQATGAMFDAVRLASPEQIAGEKQRNDFNARLESVKALLSAQRRISAEKANVKNADETTREIERVMGEAEGQAKARNFEQAMATLNRAYLLAKAAIGSMRSGDTLVRSLNFATKEEEYQYEIDRNETHELLIKVLVEEKRGNDAMIQNFVQRARALREQAEASAKRAEHAAAVRLLEQSTAELVKAIRNAGIFIPG